MLAGGGGSSRGAETAPIPAADAAQVIAAIQFGDPRHQPNLSPIDPGAQGIFPGPKWPVPRGARRRPAVLA